MDLMMKVFMGRARCLAVMTANTPTNPAMVKTLHPTMVQVAIMALTVIMVPAAIIANLMLHLNMAQER